MSDATTISVHLGPPPKYCSQHLNWGWPATI